MTIDINSLKAIYHQINLTKPGEEINAVVISPELKEILLRLKGFNEEKVNQIFGIEIYTYKYLGDMMIYGNKERLIEAGLI